MDHTNIEKLESEAYRDSYSDGLADIFIGLGMALIGGVWLWARSIAGVAGAIAAVVGWGLIPIRRRVVEPRVGYVRWSLPRVKWERNQRRLLFWMLTASVIVGVGFVQASLLDEASGGDRTVAAGLPAAFLALGAFVVAVKSGIRRLWGYGAVLLIGSVVTVVAEAGPGGSLFTAGIVIGASGIGLLVRFLAVHPPTRQT